VGEALVVGSKPMEAIVLAGGLGTRLRPLVSDRPKVLAAVGGRPFLYWVLANLARRGFTRICLAIGYLSEQVIEACVPFARSRSGTLEIIYAVEESPRGTGGAIAGALEALRPNSSVFVLNGDTYVDLDWNEMLRQHVGEEALLSIAVRTVPERSRYGSVTVNADRIVAFGEKGARGPGLINAGVYVLEPALFDFAPATSTTYSFEADLLAPNIAQIAPCAYETQAPFLDIGIPEDYALAPAFIAEHGPAE